MKAKDLLMRIFKTILIPLCVYIAFTILAPGRFGTPIAMYIVLLQSVSPTLIGFGMAFNLLVGAWDLSAGAVVSLTALFAAYAGLEHGLGALVIVCMIGALALEVVTATVFTTFKIPSIITTIGMTLIYESVSQLYRGGVNVTLTRDLTVLGSFPIIFIFLIAGAILFHIIQGSTKFGYNVYAVGNAPVIAKNIGIDVKKIRFLCFIIGGIFIGLATIIHLSYGGTVGSKSNMDSLNLTFTPIMGVVLGLSLAKHCGLTLGIFVGEVTINLITSGLVAAGLNASMQKIVTGGVLLAVLAFAGIQEILEEKRISKQKFVQAEAQN